MQDPGVSGSASTCAYRTTWPRPQVAPAFWVLADREGNEACVTTWRGRDQ